ncbi:MAG: hypothetical protein HY301_10300 [Verrucomicrobia bacterium]|nr:hypothetical protein [Verrucomicrobiota bacterium]
MEIEIKKLNQRTGQSPRRAPVNRTAAVASRPEPERRVPQPSTTEPVFEPVAKHKVPARTEAEAPAHYNEQGVRKFDLAGALRRAQGIFRGADTSNPKLVSYLAAGSIQGLKPLRYERRVARNRFILLSVVFFLLLWGILAVILRSR